MSENVASIYGLAGLLILNSGSGKASHMDWALLQTSSFLKHRAWRSRAEGMLPAESTGLKGEKGRWRAKIRQAHFLVSTRHTACPPQGGANRSWGRRGLLWHRNSLLPEGTERKERCSFPSPYDSTPGKLIWVSEAEIIVSLFLPERASRRLDEMQEEKSQNHGDAPLCSLLCFLSLCLSGSRFSIPMPIKSWLQKYCLRLLFTALYLKIII